MPRKVDELVGKDSLADLLRRRREAIEADDMEGLTKVTEEFQGKPPSDEPSTMTPESETEMERFPHVIRKKK